MKHPQPMIEYGFTSFNGVKWGNDEVDRYNRMTKEINQKAMAGMDVEWFLNARHRFFCVVCGLYE